MEVSWSGLAVDDMLAESIVGFAVADMLADFTKEEDQREMNDLQGIRWEECAPF